MNRKECLKIMVRCVAFVVVFSMLFGNATDLLMRHDDESNEIHAFYSEPEDTIDVLYVGSSPLLRGVSPMVMWQEHGFTGYVRASALQAPSVSYGLLAESLKYQNPELVVLLCDNIFPLMRYHDRWKEINLAEDKPEPLLEHSFKKGNVYLREIAPQTYPENFMEPTGETASFDESAKGYIEKSIALCKEKNIPVLLLHLPKMSWTYAQSEALEGFAAAQGVTYLDLDRAEYREQLGLDPKVDYYDQGHMNLTGTIKLSRWLGAWLDAKYALPDHREDAAISAEWNADFKEYAEKTGLQE